MYSVSMFPTVSSISVVLDCPGGFLVNRRLPEVTDMPAFVYSLRETLDNSESFWRPHHGL